MEDKWESLVDPFATLYQRVCLFPSHFTVWNPKLSAAEQIVTSYPEKPGSVPPQQPRALLGAWPVDVLGAGLHCPCAYYRTTTTVAIPQL